MSLDAWLASRRRTLPSWKVLGRDITGVVSWNLNDTCNYRCSYCTQRRLADRTGRLNDFDAALETLHELPGSWEFKLSGGEPFQQPDLIELVDRLVHRGHVISVQTNFSASDDRLRAFLEATRGALHVFSASLHLDYASVETFVERYERVVAPYAAQGLRFNVTSVATPDRLQQLHDEVAPRFASASIAFKAQPEKERGYVREYSAEQLELLLALGGHNRTGRVVSDFQGRLCHAGSRYLVVKSNGEVSRCYPAARLGGRFARLGSLRDGIELLDRARPCPYTYCNCTVPIERGMVDFDRTGQLEPIPALEPTKEVGPCS